MPGSVRLQTGKVRRGISLYVYQYILGCLQDSAGHSPVQSALTLNLGPAAELAVLGTGPGLSGRKSLSIDGMVPSNRCYSMILHGVQGCVAANHGAPFQATSAPLFLKYRNMWVPVFLNSP